MSDFTPSLPPEEGEEGEERRGEGGGDIWAEGGGEGEECVGGNVEVDNTPLQDQLARNKECK